MVALGGWGTQALLDLQFERTGQLRDCRKTALFWAELEQKQEKPFSCGEWIGEVHTGAGRQLGNGSQSHCLLMLVSLMNLSLFLTPNQGHRHGSFSNTHAYVHIIQT